MKLFITGAAGFIGQHVVEQALQAGHQVVTLVRSTIPEHWHNRENLQIVSCNLTTDPIPNLNQFNIDCVIHLAAEMQAKHKPLEDMLIGTEKLLTATLEAEIPKFILISSITVFDYLHTTAYSRINEESLKLDSTAKTSQYGLLKTAQEKRCQERITKSLIIIRPGAVYSEQNYPTYHTGIIKGKQQILINHQGEVPLVEVSMVANAILLAVASTLTGSASFNLVDDNLPSQTEYIKALTANGIISHSGIRLAWSSLFNVFNLLFILSQLLNKSNKLPELFLPAAYCARYKPFKFSNEKAKTLLNWQAKNWTIR